MTRGFHDWYNRNFFTFFQFTSIAADQKCYVLHFYDYYKSAKITVSQFPTLFKIVLGLRILISCNSPD